MTDAFAPAHITGFFAVRPDPDPLKAGSVGSGLCLEKGVTASISKETDEFKIRFNGQQIQFPTVSWVTERLLGPDPRLIVDLKSDVPLGFGFGASGAAALSTAFAIKSAFELEISMSQLAAAAHVGEVMNRTGMGDVSGQCAGGLSIRTVPGAPGIGTVEKIPFNSVEISWVCLGDLPTASILGDEHTVKRINKAGEQALKLLIKDPNIENFMSLSKKFAVEAELLSSRALDAVEAVEAQGGKASMAMLGDTVFALGNERALSEFGYVYTSGISSKGAYYPINASFHAID